MALPGIGTQVRYHSSLGWDVPAVVYVNYDTMPDGFADNYGMGDGVHSGETWIGGVDAGGTGFQAWSTEGTSTGQFSLLELEVEE